jgi:hypothetical protein
LADRDGRDDLPKDDYEELKRLRAGRSPRAAEGA